MAEPKSECQIVGGALLMILALLVFLLSGRDEE